MMQQLRDAVRSLGLVFGDIGTSPIYALSVCLAFMPLQRESVIGLASLIIWTLVMVVGCGYLWLASGLTVRGEGGSVVIRGIICRGNNIGHTATWVTLLSFIGLALMIGDGIITPAISLLSSVEGLKYYHHFAAMQQWHVAMIAASLALLLFVSQKYGSGRLGSVFGPIMLVWFLLLLVSGAVAIAELPRVLTALDPRHGLAFLLSQPGIALPLLSAVVLVTAGSEALYADLGQIGVRPVRTGALLVLPAVVVSYLGQSAYILKYGQSTNPLFEMLARQLDSSYPLAIALSIAATAIASQAVISGVFSGVYQGITRRVLPKLNVVHLSRSLHGQVFLPAVNRMMLVAVLLLIFFFGSAHGLAGAYGLAASGSMLVTSLLMIVAYGSRKRWLQMFCAALLLPVNIVFVAACFTKLGSGGWLSLGVSSSILGVILLWLAGNRKLHENTPPTSYADFSARFAAARKDCTLPGTAVFLVRHTTTIPLFMERCICQSGIAYERNIVVTITRTGQPDGISSTLCNTLIDGVERLEVIAGYLVNVDVEACFKSHEVNEKVVFYGDEDIFTKNPVWWLFRLVKQLTPGFASFNKLPRGKLQGIVVRVEI